MARKISQENVATGKGSGQPVNGPLVRRTDGDPLRLRNREEQHIVGTLLVRERKFCAASQGLLRIDVFNRQGKELLEGAFGILGRFAAPAEGVCQTSIEFKGQVLGCYSGDPARDEQSQETLRMLAPFSVWHEGAQENCGVGYVPTLGVMHLS
jgi:hypothetical protein